MLIRFDDGVVRQCGEFELRQTKLRSRKTADEQFYTDGIRPDLPTPTKPERQSGSQLMCRTLFVPGSVLNRLTAAAQFSESFFEDSAFVFALACARSATRIT